jgi:hypothetical protein
MERRGEAKRNRKLVLIRPGGRLGLVHSEQQVVGMVACKKNGGHNYDQPGMEYLNILIYLCRLVLLTEFTPPGNTSTWITGNKHHSKQALGWMEGSPGGVISERIRHPRRLATGWLLVLRHNCAHQPPSQQVTRSSSLNS